MNPLSSPQGCAFQQTPVVPVALFPVPPPRFLLRRTFIPAIEVFYEGAIAPHPSLVERRAENTVIVGVRIAASGDRLFQVIRGIVAAHSARTLHEPARR